MSVASVECREAANRLQVLIESGEAYLIVDEGKARAVIMPVDQYHAMMDAIETPEDPAARQTASGVIRGIVQQP